MLDREDVPVIQDIAARIPLDQVNVVSDVNYAIKAQIELESAIGYLYCKYHAYLDEAKEQKETLWVRSGQTHGARSPDRTLDAAYQRMVSELTKHSGLMRTITEIRDIAHARRDKLEHLSHNYRRELADD